MKKKHEPARIRENGTRVMNAKSAAEILDAMRVVVKEGFSKINGLTVDLTTASMVVKTTEALNEINRGKWFTKIDGYFAEGKDASVILMFWIDFFWKINRPHKA